MKDKELIVELNSRDKKIKEIESKIEELSKNNKSSELKKQNAELIDIITNSNNVYLYEIFENRYIKDKNYFNDVDIDDKTTSKIENSIVLVNTILAGKNCSSQDRSMGEKVLKLRTNYLKFIELEKEYQNVIKEKSNEQNTANLVSKLDSLQFDLDSKLDKRKQEYLGLLKNYNKFTCELNKDIAKLLKNPKQDNPLVKKAYEDLKKNSAYKNYPYFIKILDKVKNNYIIYVENEDLPCLEKEETKPKEDNKEVQKTIEEKKE
ncbi:MAG: hypothetical protein E6R13_07720 [Spirochaetes bacterium]|nr:MAG: hypothetical protein E6R13_07720 [Spirochaetota bacterium]